MKKRTLLLLCPLFIIYSCQKEKAKSEQLACLVTAVDDSENNIVGEWKLVKGVATFQSPDTVDYSCKDIVYVFKQDGTLTINSNRQSNIGLEDEDYNYELILSPLDDNVNEKHTLKIGELNSAINIGSKEMIINNSYLDGPILFFYRIK
jgi:hypothetical protein